MLASVSWPKFGSGRLTHSINNGPVGRVIFVLEYRVPIVGCQLRNETIDRVKMAAGRSSCRRWSCDDEAHNREECDMPALRSRSNWVFPFVVCSLLCILSASAKADETALDRYIAKPDPSYRWELASTHAGQGLTTFVISLTSQTWRTAGDVDHPVWKHWLTVARPEKARAGTAFLFIGGGSRRNAAPEGASPRVRTLARDTNTVVAELSMVPNQPLAFVDSPDQGRSEDDLIAYSRVKYIITGDEEWLVRLAMVKSGVKAMDCLQQFLAGNDGGHLKIDKFVVAGGSKRGWTTWLIGTVDPRVTAIIPLVIDALNSEQITRHHFEAYGFFSPALKDYVHHGLFPYRVGTPEYQRVLAIEDPYSYRRRERLKIPKYLVNASGDQFFLPDNSQFYFADMPQEKYLRYVPNAKHNLAGSDAQDSYEVFYQSVLDGRSRPRYSWKKLSDGTLEVRTEDGPKEVNVWSAVNPSARDFRLDVIGKAWKSTPLKSRDGGVYIGRFPKPETGFRAFFVELVYDSGYAHPFKFTTEVSVVPDVLPYNWATAKPVLGP
jgi:PhoPQ-activated pathogenicity-related protein